MADALCDHCHEEPAVFLFGGLQTGAKYYGAGCMARAGLDLARTVLDPEEIADFLGPMFVKGAAETGAASKSKRGKRSEPETEAAESEPKSEAAEGVEEAATAANDA